MALILEAAQSCDFSSCELSSGNRCAARCDDPFATAGGATKPSAINPTLAVNQTRMKAAQLCARHDLSSKSSVRPTNENILSICSPLVQTEALR